MTMHTQEKSSEIVLNSKSVCMSFSFWKTDIKKNKNKTS